MPVPWKDLIQQAKTATGDWVGLDVTCILICVFAPLFSLCSHSTLTAGPFLRQLHFLPASQSRVEERGSGRSGSSSNSSDSSSGSRPGGDHSAGILRAGSPGVLGVGWAAVALTEVLKRLQASRPNLPSLPRLSSQPTSKVLTQEKDKGSNCWERGVETWTTDMTSLQLLGAWGDILRGIC